MRALFDQSLRARSAVRTPPPTRVAASRQRCRTSSSFEPRAHGGIEVDHLDLRETPRTCAASQAGRRLPAPFRALGSAERLCRPSGRCRERSCAGLTGMPRCRSPSFSSVHGVGSVMKDRGGEGGIRVSLPSAPGRNLPAFPRRREAITGMCVARETARVSAQSKPSCTPSVSMEVNSISPAPSDSPRCGPFHRVDALIVAPAARVTRSTRRARSAAHRSRAPLLATRTPG